MKSQTLYPRLLFIKCIAMLLILTSCGSARQGVDKGLIYEVVNYCLANSELSGKNSVVLGELAIGNQSVEDYTSQSYTEYFSKEDINYIFQQAKDSTKFRLNSSRITSPVTLISAQKLDESTNEIHGKGLTIIEKPLFSLDYKTAIVAVGYFCGNLCGSGGTYILRKEKNGWYVVKTVSLWIS